MKKKPATSPDISQPITLRKVAEEAGVSIATASKALNNQGRMSDETRLRVQNTAKALGFRPNSLARSLLRKRTFTVGLLTNDSYGRFSLPVMSGIEAALSDNGVAVFLCNTDEDAKRGQRHLESLLEKRVDGIIVTGRRIDRALPVDLSALSIPVVYAFSQPVAGAVALIPDDDAGAALAVDHLIAQGRRRIVHVTGRESFEAAHIRADAYARTLALRGLPVTTPLFGDWTERWGHQAVEHLFSSSSETLPDAVFCGNDQIARGVIDALREKSIRVPSDVAVVGFDNWEIVAMEARPPLTSIDMNLTEIGRRAGTLLLDLVNGEVIEPAIIRNPCSLIVRESCGAKSSC